MATTVSVLDWPAIMVVGSALIRTVGIPGGVTVTVACAVAVVPPDPLTVIM